MSGPPVEIPVDSRDYFRFFKRVERRGNCWIWTGRFNETGYGRLSINGVLRFAHRVSWVIHNGPIPPGLYVCHRCDVKACVKPGHLFLGTAKDNAADAVRKGRMLGPRGEKSGSTKLNAELVQEIRRRLRSGEMQRDIARSIGINQSCVSRIATGKSWGHLPHEEGALA